ncbi:hypothetical protein [Allobaculum sp. JKK-2023]|uniref:hypothetical protein n=1 Tax=Allobaculum sp. JKK-2023 TaxID=3108943 RepID=UPI002B05CB9E|nr:hypothetical protein [Allobaculum sp. JKK-2023]
MKLFAKVDPGLDVGVKPAINKHIYLTILLAALIPLACGLLVIDGTRLSMTGYLCWTVCAGFLAWLRDKTEKFFPLTVVGQCLHCVLLFLCGMVAYNAVVLIFSSPVYSVLLMGNGVAIGLVLIMVAVLLVINRSIDE